MVNRFVRFSTEAKDVLLVSLINPSSMTMFYEQ